MLSNLGVFFVYGAGIVLTGILIAVFKPIVGTNSTFDKILQKLKKTFMWNGVFRFIILGTLKMQVAAGAVVAFYFRQSE